MPEVAGRLTECRRLVSLHKLAKSFEAYFWEIKINDEIYQNKKKNSEARQMLTRYRKLSCNQKLISGKDISCVLFIIFSYFLSFDWRQTTAHLNCDPVYRRRQGHICRAP